MFFNRIKGSVYYELVNQLWIHGTDSKHQISSYVLGQKFCITEKSISKLLNHDRNGKRCFDMISKKVKLEEITVLIFQDAKNSSNTENLHKRLRVWLRILLMETLQELNLNKEIVTDVGKIFNGRNLKNMSLIYEVIDPLEVLDRDAISSRRIAIDDYPLFTKLDPPEILQAYIDDCLASCIETVAYL